MLLRVMLALTCVSALRAMFGAAWVPVSDPDVWWVAAAGRAMLAIHAVPRANMFSFVEPDHPWIMHEWALGPVYALGLSQLGPAFFSLVGVAILASGLFLIARTTLARSVHPFAGALSLCVSALFFLGRLQTARPAAVTSLLPLLLVALGFGPSFTRKHLVWCVACVWVWANVHGSFPLGVALLAAAALDQARDRKLRIVASLAAAAVTLINPYGWRLHGFVFDYLTGRAGIYREIHAVIPEFGGLWSVWGSLLTLRELLGFLVVTAMALVAMREQQHRVRAALCLCLLLLAVRQARHLQLAGLLSSVLLVPWVDAWVQRRMPPQAADARTRRRLMAWVLTPIYALGALTLGGAYAQRGRPVDWIAPELRYATALPQVPESARLFVPFAAAGAAIWYGFPRGIRVFFDSRNDCYSVTTLRAYAQLSRAYKPGAEAQARAMLNATATDTVLVPNEHPLIQSLVATPEWQRIERDGVSLFRHTPANATSP